MVTYELVYTQRGPTKEERLDISQSSVALVHPCSVSRDGEETPVTMPSIAAQIAKEDSLRNIPDVIYHMGNMYVENLTSVRPELTEKKLTLNALYEKIGTSST